MSQVCVTFTLLVLFSVRLVYGFPGDNVMLMPPFEGRNVDSFLTHPSLPDMFQFQANRNKPQQVLKTNVMNTRQPLVPVTEKPSNQNITFRQFMESLNEVSQQFHKEELPLRTAAATGRDGNQAYPTPPRPMGYSRPNYAPPSTYATASPAPLTPPSSAQPKIPSLKPLDFTSLIAPVTTKVSNKFSGLIGLILSLFSGGSSGLKLTGLKDILIEGIIKPLFVVKGGLKALISKLSIPVIALLLINVEVLITIWWLWEECSPEHVPEPAPYPPTYSKPAPYTPTYSKPAPYTPTYSKPASVPSYTSNYNSYR